MGLIVGLSLSPLAANLLHSPSSRLRTPFRFKGRHQTGVRESTKSNSDLDNPLLPIILFFFFLFLSDRARNLGLMGTIEWRAHPQQP